MGDINSIKVARGFFNIVVIVFTIFSCDEIDKTAAPTTPNPPDGSIISTISPTLSWECEGALSFDVLLDTINPPKNLIIEKTRVDTIKVTGLRFNTPYYWQVIAHYNGEIISGNVWMFKTMDIDSFHVPHNPYPPNGLTIRTDTLTIRWECKDVSSYLIALDRGELCCEGYFGGGSNFIKLAGLQKESAYYWTVTACFPNDYDIEGPRWNFNISDYDSISPITDPFPQNGSLLSDINTPVNWKCTGGFIYYIYIGTDSLNMKKVLTLDYIGTDFKNLAYEKTYYWQVVVGRGYEIIMGPIWNFRTPLSPGKLSISVPDNIVQVKYYHVFTDQFGTSTGTDTLNWVINYFSWNSVNSIFKSIFIKGDSVLFSMNPQWVNANGYILINQEDQTLSVNYRYTKNERDSYYVEEISYSLELTGLPFLISGRNISCVVNSNDLLSYTNAISFRKFNFSSSQGLQYWGTADLLSFSGYSPDQTLNISIHNFFREN